MKNATLILAIMSLLVTIGFTLYHFYKNRNQTGKIIIYKK